MRKLMRIFVILFLITILPIGIRTVKATEASSQFEGYYPIRTVEDFNNIRNNTSAKYYLANDIVFSDSDFVEGGRFFNSGQGWIPIDGFTGILNGNGYSIKNLKILSTNSGHAGLFNVNLGTILNLGLDKISYNYTYEYTGTSNNVMFFSYAGGIAAENRGLIERCYNTGDITVNVKHKYGKSNIAVAGIAGINKGRIDKCYNEAPIQVMVTKGSNNDNEINIGGIVGFNSGTITNSYNTSMVGYNSNKLFSCSTGNNSGGIAGYNSGIIRAVYNTGTILDKFTITFKESIGAIVGYNYNNSSISEAYYHDESFHSGTGNFTNQKTSKRTSYQLKKKNYYAGFDFENVWEISSDKKYPYATLKGMKRVEIKSIEMKKKPNKIEYSKGEPLNLTGGVIEVIYEDDSKKEVELVTDMVSGYDSQVIGRQNLTVKYSDNTTNLMVYVKKNAAPQINVEDITIYMNDELDIMNGVTAFDEEDGNITGKIKVIENDLNTNRIGVYTVIYSVSDNNGNTVTEQRRVEVIARPIEDEEEVFVPIIYAEDVVLNLGHKFEPLNYVYAADSFDDIIECEVVRNEVNVYEVGEYEVEYRAMNSKGIEATKCIKVTVIDDGRPIITAENRFIYLNDTFNILEGVTAFDKKDGELTNKIIVKGTVNTSKVGEYEITYSVKDRDDNIAEKTVVIIVRYAKEDLNKDGFINYEDLKYITEYYNIDSTDESWSWIEEYDMNNDGIIDICDYVILNEKIMGYIKENIDLDFNKDGIINTEDLNCIVGKYNILSDDYRFDWKYDLNVDGIVDICDYIIANELIHKHLEKVELN